jgi:hypothetical protein
MSLSSTLSVGGGLSFNSTTVEARSIALLLRLSSLRMVALMREEHTKSGELLIPVNST